MQQMSLTGNGGDKGLECRSSTERQAIAEAWEMLTLNPWRLHGTARNSFFSTFRFRGKPGMKELLKLLRGARLIAKGQCDGKTVYHWLLADGIRVLEIVR